MKLYRADGRILNLLVKTGFEGSPAMTLPRSKKYLEEYLSATSKKNLAGHNWGNDNNLISTATDKGCAGQTGGKSDHHRWVWRYRPIYEFTIPKFLKREISLKTLGFTHRTFKSFPPILYMNSSTLRTSTMFGLRRRSNAEEITMFSSISFRFFTGIASLGEVKSQSPEQGNALTNYTGRKLNIL